ncbi:uncharacterized protein [Dermacentor andersoni]|uniref:uncharacterized protein n=1 Tax=Dermacentor andersoni TaxID=34620 RepID=UPI002155B7C5|nr:uncharacterized protein LOC126544117 [Dermacentor andersoni]
MAMSHDALMYFLALIQQRPALWDVSNDDYQIRPLKQSLWEEITAQMTRKWPSFGPCNTESLRTLFANKRRTYRLERKKMRDKGIPETAAAYTGKWRYFRVLDNFLSGVMQTKASSESLEEQETETAQEGFEEVLLPDDYGDESQQFHILGGSSVASTRASSPEVVQSQPESSKRRRDPEPAPTPSRLWSAENSRRPGEPESSTSPYELWAQTQSLARIARAVEQSIDADDAAGHFGKTVAALLRPLNGKRLVKCQAEILAVIENHLVE